MPTLEPRLAGLTKTGNPSARRPSRPRPRRRRVPRRSAAPPREGPSAGPRAAKATFIIALSIADRRGQHARADVGHVAQFEQPLHRAVLAVGAVQHREDHVERQPGDVRVLARGRLAGARSTRQQRLLARDAAPGTPRAPSGSTRPASCRALAMTSAATTDVGGRSGIVQRPSRSMRIGTGSYRWRSRFAMTDGRRRQRHLVLARPPAVDHADPEFSHVARRPPDPSYYIAMTATFGFRVTATDGRARRGEMATPHGDRADAGLHARRHAGRSQGGAPARSRRGRRRDHARRTPTTSICGPATSWSPASAACTGSSAGTGRS